MVNTIEKLRSKYSETTVIVKNGTSDIRVAKFITKCERQIDFAEQMKQGHKELMENNKPVHKSTLGFGPDGKGGFGAKLRYGPRTVDAFDNGGKPQKCSDLGEVIEFYKDFIVLANDNPEEISVLVTKTLGKTSVNQKS